MPSICNLPRRRYFFKHDCKGPGPECCHCCHHVRIANYFVEAWDTAMVPKASFTLGYRRSAENLTVTNCVLLGLVAMLAMAAWISCLTC